jgi:hypothetical protein
MLSLTSSSAGSFQVSSGYNRLVQARQAADQAEAYARTMRAEATDAQSEAQRARDRAEALSEEQLHANSGRSSQSASNASPVINLQGEPTGRMINTTA